MTVADILEQVKQLTPQERKELATLLVEMVRTDTPTRQRQLSELRGLGKEIWTGVDAQDYVNQLRDEWDTFS